MKKLLAFFNDKSLFRYKVGLAVLLVFSLVVALVVVVKAGDVRHDKDVVKKSQTIATDLNKYVSENNEIPKDLNEAKIKDVPDAITYKRLSDKQYEFCVTYKTAVTLSDVMPAPVSMLGSAMGSGGGGTVTDYEEMAEKADRGTRREASTLTVPTTHKKGKDCQKVEPYLYRSSSSNTYLQQYLDRMRSGNSSSRDLNAL